MPDDPPDDPPEAADAPAPDVDAAPDEPRPAASQSEVPADDLSDADALADQAAIDELLRQASFEDPDGAPSDGPPVQSLDLPNFQQSFSAGLADGAAGLDLLRDVDLNVKIELGRSRMLVEDVLRLAEGSVVELDKLAGDPVDVFVNDRLVARGEVLVLNDNFCVRVNEIISAPREEEA